MNRSSQVRRGNEMNRVRNHLPFYSALWFPICVYWCPEISAIASGNLECGGQRHKTQATASEAVMIIPLDHITKRWLSAKGVCHPPWISLYDSSMSNWELDLRESWPPSSLSLPSWDMEHRAPAMHTVWWHGRELRIPIGLYVVSRLRREGKPGVDHGGI